MLFGAEVFAGDRGDFGPFEQVIGHVAGSLELLARGGLAEESAHVWKHVECALGFETVDAADFIHSLDDHFAPSGELAHHDG